MKKTDVQTDILKEILAELRRINANLERRVAEQDALPGETVTSEAEDMDEFE